MVSPEISRPLFAGRLECSGENAQKLLGIQSFPPIPLQSNYPDGSTIISGVGIDDYIWESVSSSSSSSGQISEKAYPSSSSDVSEKPRSRKLCITQRIQPNAILFIADLKCLGYKDLDCQQLNNLPSWNEWGDCQIEDWRTDPFETNPVSASPISANDNSAISANDNSAISANDNSPVLANDNSPRSSRDSDDSSRASASDGSGAASSDPDKFGSDFENPAFTRAEAPAIVARTGDTNQNIPKNLQYYKEKIGSYLRSAETRLAGVDATDGMIADPNPNGGQNKLTKKPIQALDCHFYCARIPKTKTIYISRAEVRCVLRFLPQVIRNNHLEYCSIVRHVLSSSLTTSGNSAVANADGVIKSEYSIIKSPSSIKLVCSGHTQSAWTSILDAERRVFQQQTLLVVGVLICIFGVLINNLVKKGGRKKRILGRNRDVYSADLAFDRDMISGHYNDQNINCDNLYENPNVVGYSRYPAYFGNHETLEVGQDFQLGDDGNSFAKNRRQYEMQTLVDRQFF